MANSAALFRASNVVVMDYCIGAAVQSALSICDEAVIVVDTDSRDETVQRVLSIAREHPDRVTVVPKTWDFDRMWQERVWNWGADATDAEWLMYHDADEVIGIGGAEELRGLMRDPAVKLISLPYRHFYGTPNWEVVEGFYPRNTRLGRRSHGYRMRNWCSDHTPQHAVCQVVWGPEERNANDLDNADGLVTSQVPMMHYGWCRNARAMAISQEKHRAWYADGAGLEDGRIPEVEPWDFGWRRMFSENKLAWYEGDHPTVTGRWFDRHYAEWGRRELQATWARGNTEHRGAH